MVTFNTKGKTIKPHVQWNPCTPNLLITIKGSKTVTEAKTAIDKISQKGLCDGDFYVTLVVLLKL